MPRSSGSKDVAPIIRGAFKRAVAQLDNGGRPLSDIIREHLESDFLGTLRAIASFTPKEIEQTIERKRSIDDFTDEELAVIAGEATSGSAEEGTKQLH